MLKIYLTLQSLWVLISVAISRRCQAYALYLIRSRHPNFAPWSLIRRRQYVKFTLYPLGFEPEGKRAVG